MGDALGNVTPFGVLISEPSKVAFVRRRVGAEAAISAVTIENLFYIASVVVVFVCGTGALLLSFDVGIAQRRTASLTLGVAVGFPLLTIGVVIRRVRIGSVLVAACGVVAPAAAYRREPAGRRKRYRRVNTPTVLRGCGSDRRGSPRRARQGAAMTEHAYTRPLERDIRIRDSSRLTVAATKMSPSGVGLLPGFRQQRR